MVIDPEPHFDPRRVLDLVEREGIVSVNLTGDATALPLLAALEGQPGRWDTSSVRIMGSGGAMMAAASKQRLIDAIPSLLVITEAIGSSETPVQGISIVTRQTGAGESLRFLPREETRVIDDDGRPVEPGSGQVGRLATRGRLPLGYHGDEEKTARTFVDIDGERWSLPGDMATLEADGTIKLLGRGSLCINTGGEKVYPEEVEAVLVGHPAVADALVVGRADPTWGEQVVTVLAPAHGAAAPTLEELQDHCRGRLAGYKIPRAVFTVDAVRRSPAGKGDYAWAAEVAGARDPSGSGTAP
jgi:acyl-CoA synthetase (AMP-forming)/AMP-acid ligase II